MGGQTYRRLLATSAIRSRRDELERLEKLRDQLNARIDTLKAELTTPWPDEEVTPWDGNLE